MRLLTSTPAIPQGVFWHSSNHSLNFSCCCFFLYDFITLITFTLLALKKKMVLKGSSMYNSMGHSDKNLDLSKVLWQVNCELGLNHLSLKIQTNSPSPQEVYFAIPSGHQ